MPVILPAALEEPCAGACRWPRDSGLEPLLRLLGSQGWEAHAAWAPSFHQLDLARLTVSRQPEGRSTSKRLILVLLEPPGFRPDFQPRSARSRDCVRRHRSYRETAATDCCLVGWSLSSPTPDPALAWAALAYSLIPRLLLFALPGMAHPATGGRGHRPGGDAPTASLGLATLFSQWFLVVSHRWLETNEAVLPVMALSPCFVCLEPAAAVGDILAEERRINGQVLMGAVAAYLAAGASPPACC